MIKNRINLEDFRVQDKKKKIISKVFTGRDFGKFVREESRIDELENKSDIIEIIVPNNIYSINPSFLEEFLVNVVAKLGREVFFEKFKFISQGDYDITKPLSEAIDRILRTENALE